VQRRDIAMELEAPALPPYGSAHGLDNSKFGPLLQFFERHQLPLDHDCHCRAWIRSRKSTQLQRLRPRHLVQPAKSTKHIDDVEGRSIWLIKINNVPVIEIDGEAFLARCDGQDSGLPAESQHLERCLKTEGFQVPIEYPPLWLHLPPLATQ